MTRSFSLQISIWSIALSASIWCLTADAALITVSKSVSGTSGPWVYTVGGLNTTFQYGANNHAAPTDFALSDGFQFSQGDTLTIAYVSGLTNSSPGAPAVDAAGDVNTPINDALGGTGKVMPSFYFDHADYPANLNALVGAFANVSGAIVGTPFLVGIGRAVTIPGGATRLQLGINDDFFPDNAGALNVTVTGLAVIPEPASGLHLCLGLLGLLGYRNRKVA